MGVLAYGLNYMNPKTNVLEELEEKIKKIQEKEIVLTENEKELDKKQLKKIGKKSIIQQINSIMTDTNIIDREPTKFDYASPIQFRFKMSKLPQVEFFVQTANIPGIALGSTSFETPLKDIAGVGDKVTYQTLDVSFC